MNILVIGFGNMGCRHAQAFLQDNSYKVSVIEPNGTVFNSNLPRIGGTNENISRTTFAECQKNFFDFAVIATSAEMRLTLFKEVLNIGIKNILLEKVVFQSAAQFDEALNSAEEYNASVYCNFLNRYSQSYNEIKNAINGPIDFTVTGGHFGFACNALHYIDLFKYFTGTDITLIKSNLVKSESPNVRGDKYVEVFGQQIWESENGDRLFISSDSENNSGKGSENQIRYRKNVHIINENTLNQFNIGSNGKLEVRKFDMPMASKLTETLYQNIKAGTIKLPDIKETMNYHLQFFESINNSLGLLKSDSCPIT
jgi:predicted dehydrogenase